MEFLRFGTVRTLLQSVSPEELATKFARWMEQYFPVEQEQWLALDGKPLVLRFQNPHGSLQSFVYVVSVFAQRGNLVHQMVHFESGKAYEAEAVRQLVEKLGLKVPFPLDALHCQKNANAHSRTGFVIFLIQVKAIAINSLHKSTVHRPMSPHFSVCETIEKDMAGWSAERSFVFNQVDLPSQGRHQRIVRVKRWGKRKGKPFGHTA
ncbi:MAG: hypothetical protein IPH12_07645 [Saprospirales bacterium]|nr:hypothetical protein [Saprospirales bacterium]